MQGIASRLTNPSEALHAVTPPCLATICENNILDDCSTEMVPEAGRSNPVTAYLTTPTRRRSHGRKKSTSRIALRPAVQVSSSETFFNTIVLFQGFADFTNKTFNFKKLCESLRKLARNEYPTHSELREWLRSKDEVVSNAVKYRSDICHRTWKC